MYAPKYEWWKPLSVVEVVFSTSKSSYVSNTFPSLCCDPAGFFRWVPGRSLSLKHQETAEIPSTCHSEILPHLFSLLMWFGIQHLLAQGPNGGLKPSISNLFLILKDTELPSKLFQYSLAWASAYLLFSPCWHLYPRPILSFCPSHPFYGMFPLHLWRVSETCRLQEAASGTGKGRKVDKFYLRQQKPQHILPGPYGDHSHS